jgi:hypothetical protein
MIPSWVRAASRTAHEHGWRREDHGTRVSFYRGRSEYVHLDFAADGTATFDWSYS